MEIPTEKLDKINNSEYVEYENLKNVCFEGDKYEGFAFAILHFSICLSILLIFLAFNDYQEKFSLFQVLVMTVFFAIHPLSWLITFGVVYIVRLEKLYKRTYKYFARKTYSYSRFEDLHNYFAPLEQDIESEAIIILSKVENKARIRLDENKSINDYLHYKRKRELYLDEVEKATKNFQLNQKSLTIVNKNIDYVKNDFEKQKHFEKLQHELNNEHIKWMYEPSLNQKLKEKQARQNKHQNLNSIPSIKKYKSSNKISSKNNLKNENQYKQIHTNTKLDDETFRRKNKIRKTDKEETIRTSNSEEKSAQNSHQPTLNFDSQKIKLQDTDNVPKKRKTPDFEPRIKASPKFYKELADKKIEIGLKGELLVLEYERQRLIDEEEKPKTKLRHTSVEDGDGYGYDICSFENGKKIYIEVKTTTGSFWSNLFFTQNEFNKMEKYGEQYYLYRVCSFDIETNQAELFIFKGEDFIRDYFNFESKVYVLTQKQS